MKKKTFIHHVSALVRDVERSYPFYHKLLGLNLLMKTVNQEDTKMYHVFFTDKLGRPGTDFTIFGMKTGKENRFGTNAIERTVFVVPSEDSLEFWVKRLSDYDVFNCGIESYNESKIVRFEDFDGLKFGLVPLRNPQELSDFYPNESKDIPAEHAILAFDSVHFRVRYPEATEKILNDFFDFQPVRQIQDERFPVTVLESAMSPFYHEIHLIKDTINPRESTGIGGVHHIAFSAETKEDIEAAQEAIAERNFYNTGIKNRDFFVSTYFREANQILFEIATLEGNPPKVVEDQSDFKNIPLFLPSHLESKREDILRNLENF